MDVCSYMKCNSLKYFTSLKPHLPRMECKVGYVGDAVINRITNIIKFGLREAATSTYLLLQLYCVNFTYIQNYECLVRIKAEHFSKLEIKL